MKINLFILSLLLIIFISLLTILTYFRPLKTDIKYPYQTQSMTLQELRPYVVERFKFIKENESILFPYNKTKYDILYDTVLKNIDNSDINSVMGSFIAFDDRLNTGYIGVYPLPDQPAKYTNFQFGNSPTGWHWLYGTFIEDNGEVANYMFYIMRVDTIPEVLRRKLGLPIGTTTYYMVSGGVGVNGVWRYSPRQFCRGKYSADTETVFNFEGIDLPPGWDIKFSGNYLGNFDIKLTWVGEDGIDVKLDATTRSARPPLFAGPNGCLPCIGGLGTGYFHYTQLYTDAKIQVSDGIIGVREFKNGIGWNDRQWGGNSDNKLLQILNNVSKQSFGFGKYLWINLHLSDELQYMCYVIGMEDVVKGKTYKGIYNEYGNEIKYFKSDLAITIKEVTYLDENGNTSDEKNGIVFPTVLSLKLGVNTYTLDTRKFGNNVTKDSNNNLHWDGSAELLDESGVSVGSAFLEANQMQDNTTYFKNLLKGGNIDEKYLDIFLPKNLTFSQKWYSMLLLTIIFILLISIMVLGVKILLGNK